MQATSCPDSEQLLSYLSGTLAEAQSRTVATHLETCAGCRATVAALACRQGELETRLPDAAAGHAPANPSFVRPEVVSDIPNELGEYRILQKLGEGGMGAVYKAVHTRLDKIVALKTLPASQKGNEWIESRFDREMKAIGRLDHPNIVHAYDAREIAGTRFLVMEYVDGMDLWAVVDRCAPLAIADACELARQTALGLQAAHEQGLVHRDIKPSNLMLTRQGQVKILDLGLARFREGWTPAGETTSAGQIMGTADYIAPEQVSDSHNVDIRADIYSLGCTLYCLLTGEPPFGGGEYQGFVEKVMAHVLKPTPSIRERRGELSETLAAVVDRMLAKRPIERFAVPRDVTEALTPFVGDCNLAGLWIQCEAATKSSAATRKVSLPTAEAFGSASNTVAKTPFAANCGDGGEPTRGKPTHSFSRLFGRKHPWLAAITGLLIVAAAGFWASREIVPQREKNQVSIAEVSPTGSASRAGVEPAKVAPSEKQVASSNVGKASPVGSIEKPLPRNTHRTTQGARPAPAVAPFDGPLAKKHQEAWATYLAIAVEQTNSIGMKLTLIPPGQFDMGTAPPPTEPATKAAEKSLNQAKANATRLIEKKSDESPRHRVTITRPYCIGTCEATQDQYEGVMGTNPSRFAPRGRDRQETASGSRAQYPVESVSWPEAGEFCRRLSALPAEQAAARQYRLPTEAEWEYACRAGTTTPWYCGDATALRDYAWFRPSESDKKTPETPHPVGQKKANAWGLFDMLGNVYEWTADGYDADFYAHSTPHDPQGPAVAFDRVIRGGSYWNMATDCRCARRVAALPDGGEKIGIRVLCEIDAGN